MPKPVENDLVRLPLQRPVALQQLGGVGPERYQVAVDVEDLDPGLRERREVVDWVELRDSPGEPFEAQVVAEGDVPDASF
jgi:hypothetical protein